MRQIPMRLLTLAFLFASGAAAAQSPGYLAIETSTPEALVVADGVVLGAASEGPFALAAQTYAVALVEAGVGWDARRADASAAVASGETLTLALDLPVRTRIESLPLHAEVLLVHPDGTQEALGVTPLVLDRPEPLRGRLVASLDGYADASVAAPEAGGKVALVLRPDGATEADLVAYALPTQRRNTARTALDIGFGVAAIAAGAVAVHYKFQADAADDQYRGTTSMLRGNDDLRDDAIRYDTISGVALGVSTASLGVLAIRFAIR